MTLILPRFESLHHTRHETERSINLLKQNRAVATRYDKRAVIFDRTVQVASIRIWLRDLTRSKTQPRAVLAGCCERRRSTQQRAV
ncbi:hypothetical protein ACFQXA_09025 [Nocardiopsis composta]